jgi:hypothetical protein
MNAAHVVYTLCALTALACCVLLARGYQRSGVRLLFWSSLCFAGLFLNNLLLVAETIFEPTVSFMVIRQAPAVIGIGLLLYGLIFEVDAR